jgi:hypothetical protein
LMLILITNRGGAALPRERSAGVVRERQLAPRSAEYAAPTPIPVRDMPVTYTV